MLLSGRLGYLTFAVKDICKVVKIEVRLLLSVTRRNGCCFYMGLAVAAAGGLADPSSIE
jgi:hypothetical protein